MKPIWKGSIAFGLVNIPVKMYAAINRRPVSFRLLHQKDNSPIEYRRWCTQNDHEVPWDEVVKGVDLGDGQFYVFSKRELVTLRPKRSEVIDITEFVGEEGIERVLLDQHYYLGPEKEGQKAFFLLHQTLKKSGKLAIGSFVMREREYVCILGPYGPGIMLSTLNYLDEVRPMSEVEGVGTAPELKDKELELAEQLIEKLTVKQVDMSRFKDTYMEKLKEAIEKRDQEHLVTLEEVKPTPEANLLDALKASLES
jgi:DNA end-binding protein Ku